MRMVFCQVGHFQDAKEKWLSMSTLLKPTEHFCKVSYQLKLGL